MIFINDLNTVNYLNPFFISTVITKEKLLDSDSKIIKIRKHSFCFDYDINERLLTKDNNIFFTKEGK